MQDAVHAVKRTAIALIVVLALGLGRGTPTCADTDVSSPATGDVVPVLSVPSPVGPITYTPGRGARLGDTNLTLGGYSNLNLTRDDGGPALLSLDDLSLFVIWDPHPRVHLFSELEFEDLVQVDDHGRGGTNNWSFNAERLFGDVTLTDELNVRVGKFLTPVGRWNVIHAQPLVWTTSRPLATLLPFDPHTTGAMLWGWIPTSGGGLSYTAYGQFADQLDPSVEPQLASRSGGGRLEYTARSGQSVGVSYLSFLPDQPGHRHDVPWQNLVGLDTFLRHGPLQAMGEFAYEKGQWGLYLQGVVEVVPRVFLVGRYEHYDQRAPLPTVEIGVAGLAWKPLPYVILKAEYLFSDHRAEESPPGFKSSVAVLF
jgi:hypothetical protein